jgi:flagellin-specific chaperone FliS
MAGRVVEFHNLVSKDDLGSQISNLWWTWNTARQPWIALQEEKRKYIFATDTRQTSNSKLPWKNTTTIPKLCQIRDNLYANYMATLFPKRKWLQWDAADEDSNAIEKRESILAYMKYCLNQDRFKTEAAKLVLDYIDYGNMFGTVEWVDERQTVGSPAVQVGYVGPTIRRISPMDIVFNPTAPSFTEAPKIIRSLVTIGELKKILESQSTHEDQEAIQELYDYLVNIRIEAKSGTIADVSSVEQFYNVDGFTSYLTYLTSDYVEILTFYGDLYDYEKKEFLQNHKIMVVDRHKVIAKKPNPSYFGFPPIFHVGWRVRQDNLWAMGPLDNLVGMQYRIDHIENLKADVFDLLTFPPLKVKGYVEDFKWGPMERIYCGEEGDVEILAPPFQVLQANIEIQNLAQTMEEMAGSPREAMGIRSPGEKTAFEVQKLDNATSRIFISKTNQLEEQGFERLMNAMLELARRNLQSVMAIPIFDDDYKIQMFEQLTPEDIVGAGTLKPIAARHFAEKAEIVQNLTNLYNSAVGQDPMVLQHFSSLATARMIENVLNLEDWKIVIPNVRISEMAEAERMKNAADEETIVEAGTPTGLTPDDVSPEMLDAAEY